MASKTATLATAAPRKTRTIDIEAFVDERYEDSYEKRLKKIVQRKGKGQTVEEPERAKEPAPVPDRMAALEQTLAEIKSG